MTLGRRSAQRSLFGPDPFLTRRVRPDSFYGFLASQELFNDDEFAELYTLDNGRPSVPPSLLATALLLQTFDQVSDEEAKARADFDLRWKVALGIPLDEAPFAKSTLQLFRAQLVLHDKLQAVFKKSLDLAREKGYLKTQQGDERRKIKLALDTSYILGRGAVKDTYNLLGDGVVSLIRVLADLTRQSPETWAKAHDLARFFAGRLSDGSPSSLKGNAGIDWEDPKARAGFLSRIVKDADSLLELARARLADYPLESREHQRLKAAASLLGQLLLQDVERSAEGAVIKQGTARDRIVSVRDPEMRHGHKSKTKRFDGHKAAIAVDTESQLITAVEVLAGNAPDFEQALDLVKASEANTEVEVEETIGDCAYGAGATRQEFADIGRKLIAKVPHQPNGHYFAKEDFQIDPRASTCVCPAGQTCSVLVRLGDKKGRLGKAGESLGFRFKSEQCAECPLRSQCVKAKSGQGRTVSLHPQEALRQEAKAFQRSQAFAPYRKWRQVAEHRIARLIQLGMRQARYFGRAKTKGQLLLTSMVANLTLVARALGLMGTARRAMTG
jgi:hypothetical protein